MKLAFPTPLRLRAGALIVAGLLYPFVTGYLKLLFWHDLPEKLVHGTDTLWWGMFIHIVPGMLITALGVKILSEWVGGLLVAALYIVTIPPLFLLFSLAATCALGVDCI